LFFEGRFPNTRPVVARTEASLAGRRTIRPPASGRPYAFATAGAAIDYRVRYYFEPTSGRRLAAYVGAEALGTIPVAPDEHAIDPRTGMMIEPDARGRAAAEFFAALDQELARLRPARRRLREPDEDRLAHYCWALALYEEVYRSGRADPALRSARGAAELLALAPPEAVEDLRTLSWAFHDSRHELLSQPFVLNPTFVGSHEVGGADADLIVGGCLLDIKTTVNPRLEPWWLYQLLGYALLDYGDRHGIREVGLYYARQSTEVRWGLDELIGELSGGESPGVLELRAELQGVAARLREARFRSGGARG
jgi:hypothetical protein